MCCHTLLNGALCDRELSRAASAAAGKGRDDGDRVEQTDAAGGEPSQPAGVEVPPEFWRDVAGEEAEEFAGPECED